MSDEHRARISAAMRIRVLPTDWPSHLIVQLRTLWDEGHSTSEIGRRLGKSKNSVCAKVHRLQLPPRGSPIKRGDGEVKPRAPVRPHRSATALPPLLSLMFANRHRVELHQMATLGRRPPEPPRVAYVPLPAAPPPSTCQFPMWGDDERPGLNPKFCGEKVVNRGDKWLPYCECHRRRCYTRRAEMVAA